MESSRSIPLQLHSEHERVVTDHTSFDRRIVRYEEIHAITSEDFRTFVDAAAVSGHARILDCGCGYGAFTREFLVATEPGRLRDEIQLQIDLIDESLVQIERAREELRPWLNGPGIDLRFIGGVFPDDLVDNCSQQYSVVACKMVLHEVRREEQLHFLEDAYNCLKQEGRLVLWDVCLSPEIAPFYRAVVKSKDALAGYDSMVERRYFLTEDELVALFRASSFRSVKFIKDILYRFDTQKRFMPEFGGDEFKFAQWEEFVRQSAAALSPEVLAGLRYRDDGDSISFDVRKVIVAGKRVDDLATSLALGGE
jgi:SAM-dependent methyltransferase